MLHRLAEGHIHGAGDEDPCNFRDGDGSGTTGERVARQEVRELLPAKSTYRRVVHRLSTIESLYYGETPSRRGAPYWCLTGRRQEGWKPGRVGERTVHHVA